MSDFERRQTALIVGETYRVLRNAPNSRGPDFEADERLTLLESGYSRYDSAFVYVFETGGGMQKYFWLGDDDPVERLTGTFSV